MLILILISISISILIDTSVWVDHLLQDLPAAVVAENHEVLGFIAHHRLHGKGIGHVDVHRLMSTALTHGATLWTRDRRLRAAADDLGVQFADNQTH